MMLSGLLQDIRIGARQLARNPSFTLIAVVSLGVGIGANTATFSFADGLLLRPLPVPDASEVVSVGSLNVATGGTNALRVSYPDYVDLRDATASFAGGLVAFGAIAVQAAASSGASPEIRTATLVSGNFFAAMGVQPALGRAFVPAEDTVPGRDAVAVLSYRFWQRALGADPAVLGRRLLVNGTELTVVGVAPESFTGLDLFVRPDFYVPLMMWPPLVGGDHLSPLEQRDRRALELRGRLANAVTFEQAAADVERIGAALADEFQATNRGFQMRVRTENENRLSETGWLVPGIGMLVVLGAVILIVACVNVAGLLTSRAPSRVGEIALRLSIGAGRGRIVRQLLTSALLATGGRWRGASSVISACCSGNSSQLRTTSPSSSCSI
jgi:predicted permease